MSFNMASHTRFLTVPQAEHDVSIPDQKRQGEAYCASRGYELVETFVEHGASATNDRRPEFQRMIEAGTSKPAPFDVVIVHLFSRFFRDHFELEFYVRRLAKNGVRLVSITQEMGDDPMHVMMRQIMAQERHLAAAAVEIVSGKRPSLIHFDRRPAMIPLRRAGPAQSRPSAGTSGLAGATRRWRSAVRDH